MYIFIIIIILYDSVSLPRDAATDGGGVLPYIDQTEEGKDEEMKIKR